MNCELSDRSYLGLIAWDLSNGVGRFLTKEGLQIEIVANTLCKMAMLCTHNHHESGSNNGIVMFTTATSLK